MPQDRRIPKALCIAVLTAGLAGCQQVTRAEGNEWGNTVAAWADAISRGVCMLEQAVYDTPSTAGADGHTHTHPVPDPNRRYCPADADPNDPVVQPPGPPGFGA